MFNKCILFFSSLLYTSSYHNIHSGSYELDHLWCSCYTISQHSWHNERSYGLMINTRATRSFKFTHRNIFQFSLNLILILGSCFKIKYALAPQNLLYIHNRASQFSWLFNVKEKLFKKIKIQTCFHHIYVFTGLFYYIYCNSKLNFIFQVKKYWY